MSQELVTQAAAGGLMAFAENAFTSLATEYNVPMGDILKFDGNTGKYTHKGQPIDHGTVLAFNIMEMQRGWICWKDKKPIEKIMVRVASGERPPRKEELPDHGPYTAEGEGWSEQITIPVRDLDGGPQMELSGSSRGAINALVRLATEFGQKVRMYMDENRQPKIPLVSIGAQSFESPKFPGKKWAPTFEIVDWMSQKELQEIVDESLNGDTPADAAGASIAAIATEAQQSAAPAPAQAAPAPAQAAPAPAQAAEASGKPGDRFRRQRVGNRV